MTTPAQADFPFVSLDFPGRTTLTVDEIAARLGVTAQHVIDLIEEGAMCPAVDLAGKGASRRLLRVPVETYRNFIVARMTGEARREFLRSLPAPVLAQLREELAALAA
jgi:excisionase family DNA binding protein